MRKWRKISWKSYKCVSVHMRKASLAGAELWKGKKGLRHLAMRGRHEKRLNLSTVIKMKKKNEIDDPASFPLLKLPLQNALSLQRELCWKCGPCKSTSKALSPQAVGKLCKHLVCETTEMSYIYLHFFPSLLLKKSHICRKNHIMTFKGNISSE